MINILVGAIIFSIWSVTLFLGKSIGLSMLLFAVPITYFVLYLLEKNKKITNYKAMILLIPICLLSITYFVFNNVLFNILNLIVIPLLIAFFILRLVGEKLEVNLISFLKSLIIFIIPLTYIEESFEKIRQSLEERTKIDVDSKKEKDIGKIIRAILITIPIVVIIIILLSSADEIFGSIFNGMFKSILNIINSILVSNFIVRVILIILAFIYFSCFFYYLVSEMEFPEDEAKPIEDNITIKMILGILNIIYLIFCIIQINSLFMKNISVFDYSEYARKGFFQLMWVSIINLVTILIAKKSEKNNDEKGNKYIKIMCLVMIIFTFIILLSSTYRMYLYESAYGSTRLRLLVFCALFTEAILLVPTSLYILNYKFDLAKIYFTIIMTVYVGMNFANFDNVIATRIVDRYENTGLIDMDYIKRDIGTDGVEQIIRVLEIDKKYSWIDKEADIKKIKAEAGEYLKTIYSDLKNGNMDFRDFNISKFLAEKAISNKVDFTKLRYET